MSVFQRSIAEKYSKYKSIVPEKKSACDGAGPIKLTNMQKFISDYSVDTIKNKQGLFLYHTVGAGKTLTGVNVMKQFEQKGFSLLWVTRTTLRKDLNKALDMIKVKGPIMTLSYKQFSNACKKKGENYRRLMAASTKKGGKEFLYKTLIVIDEAHKLYTKELKPQEMHDISAIQEAIFNSYTVSANPCKVLLMSATPITKDPREAIHLINLLKPTQTERLSLNIEKYMTGTKFNQEFQNKIQGIFSYNNSSCDRSKFASSSITYIPVEISSPVKMTKAACKMEYNICKTTTLIASETRCRNAYDECVKKDTSYKVSQKKSLYEKCGLELN